MSIIGKAIGHSSNGWAVILVFALFTLFGLVVGYARGWKSALYFLTWNFLMLIVVVFTAGLIVDPLKSILKNDDVNAIIDATSTYVVPLVMVPMLIILDLLAWIPYIFIRKYLKINSESGDYNSFTGPYGSRLYGAAIGVLSVMPFTVLTTNMTAVLSGQTAFTDINDMMLTGVTFGQYKGIAKEVNTITSLIRIVEAKEDPETAGGLDALIALISGESKVDSPEYQRAIEENHGYFEDVLNSPLAHELVVKMPSVSDMFKYDPENPTAASSMWSDLTSFQRPELVKPFNLTDESKKSLESTLMTLYTMSLAPGASPTLTDADFTEFITKLTT